MILIQQNIQSNSYLQLDIELMRTVNHVEEGEAGSLSGRNLRGVENAGTSLMYVSSDWHEGIRTWKKKKVNKLIIFLY